jgi:hypothetical protein
MRPLLLCAALLSLAGCEQQWQLAKPPPPVTSAPPSPEAAKLRKTRDALEKRLAEVDHALEQAAAKPADEAAPADALHAERLRLTVALRLVDERIAEPVAAPAPEPEAMLAEADGRIAESREHPGKDVAGDAVGLFGGAKAADAAPAPAEEAWARAEREQALEEERKHEDELRHMPDDSPPPPEGGEGPGWEDGKKIATGKEKPARRRKGGKKPGGIEKAMVLPGRDPTADVESAIDREMGRLRQCVAQGGGAGAVDLTVHAQLSADGTLRRVRLTDAKLAPQIGDCIVRVLEGLRVPGVVGDEQQISVPLSLR